MNRANPTHRQQGIRRLLVQRGTLGVGEAASRFGVNAMTIRRDLAAMEKRGILLRTHGGCVLQAPMVREFTFSEKIRQNAAQKAAIAEEAVKRISEGETVYLDTGTTALQVARELPCDLGLSVCTGNLRVAMELFGRENIEVIVLGGTLGRKSPDLVGPMPAAHLAGLHLDAALLGADAVDPARGECYSADLQTAELSRAAQKRSDRCILLVDSSKLNRKGLAVMGRLGRGMTMITDECIGKRDLGALRKTGAEIVVAKCPPLGRLPVRQTGTTRGADSPAGPKPLRRGEGPRPPDGRTGVRALRRAAKGGRTHGTV